MTNVCIRDAGEDMMTLMHTADSVVLLKIKCDNAGKQQLWQHVKNVTHKQGIIRILAWAYLKGVSYLN